MSKVITFEQKGSFKKTTKFLNYVSDRKFITNKLIKYANKGITLLKEATPVDSGETSKSWGYEIEITKDSCKIVWTNDHMGGNVPVVILLQYGHATNGGGYVQGIDFINPAMKPLFEELANDVWKEVTNA